MGLDERRSEKFRQREGNTRACAIHWHNSAAIHSRDATACMMPTAFSRVNVIGLSERESFYNISYAPNAQRLLPAARWRIPAVALGFAGQIKEAENKMRR